MERGMGSMSGGGEASDDAPVVAVVVVVEEVVVRFLLLFFAGGAASALSGIDRFPKPSSRLGNPLPLLSDERGTMRTPVGEGGVRRPRTARRVKSFVLNQPKRDAMEEEDSRLYARLAPGCGWGNDKDWSSQG